MSPVDNGLIASSWGDGLQMNNMCWANQQHVFTLDGQAAVCLHGAKQKYVLLADGHAAVCHGEGRYG
jgi:hypothetical protein